MNVNKGVGVPVTGFEGPEKRLEVIFKSTTNRSPSQGLRQLNKEQWQEMLTLAKCTILSHSKNEFFDAFVLSESSLFVYPSKIMIKTCGTTTLLNCISKLLQFASNFELEVETVIYSRKNFVFPQEQIFPHGDWNAEVAYLNSMFEGTAYVLGPLTEEHWYLYVADYSNASSSSSSAPQQHKHSRYTLEMMMHRLDHGVCDSFYRKDTTGDTDKYPGMADIIPRSLTDEFNFTPCGYSMNGLNKESLYTIHVTPEYHCSYASYETNISLPCYKNMIQYVLSLFKPGMVTLTFFVNNNYNYDTPNHHPTITSTTHHHHDHYDEDITTAASSTTATSTTAMFPLELESIDGYRLKHKTFCELEGNKCVLMCNLESTEECAKKPKLASLPEFRTDDNK
jgi:S-adenosylmethionine decarboxylase